MERILLAGCLAVCLMFGASACTKSEEPAAPAKPAAAPAAKAEAPAAPAAEKPMAADEKPAAPAPAEQPDET